IWKNTKQKQQIKTIRINGDQSVWKVGASISLGTSLKELQKLNGRPFILTGMQWDYSGTVLSWEKGNLEKEFSSSGRIIIRLERSAQEEYKILTLDEAQTIAGDQEFRSDNKIMQKLNPKVYEIIIQPK